MTIPFVNMCPVNDGVLDDFIEDLQGIFKSGEFVLGSHVLQFEEAYARFIGTKFCMGVGSGSDGLLMALRAMGVGPNDEVICPAFGYASAAEAVVRVGATPVFVDVRSDSYTLDPDKTLASISSRTRAIIPVHLFGHAAEIDRLVTVARTYSVLVIEDARQSTGARNGHRRLGTYGDVAVHSFHPSAPLGGAGDGGAVTTNDEQRAQTIRQLRHRGFDVTTEHHEVVGYYSLLDSVQAALLRHKLADLDENNAESIENARLYTQMFAGTPVSTPRFVDEGNYIYNSYVVGAPDRDRLVAHLKEKGIGYSIPFARPVHMQPCFAYLNYQHGAFPIAEDLTTRALCLPIWPGLKKRQVEEVASAVLEFYGVKI
ncbi:MAG: DegT/DnrJ/EryC1/StrS family aminotransferase [Candidatus Sumerlaeia bacterium]|nr:DegT/DnrJ/EryC1/StrS family aminotransferase [Candidatus Sumerlaeia bacterium]